MSDTMKGVLKDVKVKDGYKDWACRSVLFKGKDEYQDLYCNKDYVDGVKPGVEIEYTLSQSGKNIRLVKVLGPEGQQSSSTSKSSGYQKADEDLKTARTIVMQGGAAFATGQLKDANAMKKYHDFLIAEVIRVEQEYKGLKNITGDAVLPPDVPKGEEEKDVEPF